MSATQLLYSYEVATGKYVAKLALGSPDEYKTSGQALTSVAPNTVMDYFDGEVWHTPPPSPGQLYRFNYSAHKWEIPVPIEQVRAYWWEGLKEQRTDLEYAGFEFEGKRFDSDLKSQARISAAASLGVTVEWTLEDNSSMLLEPADTQRLAQALAVHVTTVHERGKRAREAIYAAQTADEVIAITL